MLLVDVVMSPYHKNKVTGAVADAVAGTIAGTNRTSKVHSNSPGDVECDVFARICCE
jgi:hypothetical protein